MISLDLLVKSLDEEFDFYEGQDESCNGLQVEGKPQVSKIAVACDAALETIQKAINANADLLLVHHGLFCKYALIEKIDGVWKKRLKAFLDADVSLYAMHLPLDAHPTLGNNALLVRLLDLQQLQPCIDYHGANIALKGRLPAKTSLEELAERVKESVGEARIFAFHSRPVESVAVCTGGGAFCAMHAVNEGFDTLIVGEVKHGNFHDARDAGCNLIEAGHYNTEVLGVKAVGEWLEKKFGLPFVFLDAPTGL